MGKLYTLLFLTLLIPTLSRAQSNYKPGYIVTLNGDTLKGFVDYKDWGQNPAQFNFKKNPVDGQEETYNVNNCGAFAVSGYEFYRRFTVRISQNKTYVTDLTIGPDTTAIVHAVFLKLITTGSHLTLYSYLDNLKLRYYVAENNALPVELIFQSYFDQVEQTKIIVLKTYKHQLQALASIYQPNDEKLLNEIGGIEYNERDLERIVTKINGGASTKIMLQKSGGSRFFAGVAVNNTSTSFDGDPEFASTKSVSSIFPALNFGVDFFANKNVGSLIFRVGLGFTGNKVRYSKYNAGLITYYTSVLTFNQYITTLTPQLLYNFYNENAVKLYAGVGFNLNYSTYNNKSYTQNFTSGSYPPAILDFPVIQDIYYSLNTKIGLVLNKKFDCYVYYLPSQNIGNNEYDIHVAQYGIGINYLFGTK